jgi:CcmD family protein
MRYAWKRRATFVDAAPRKAEVTDGLKIPRFGLGRESMKNLNFLVAAYIAIWAIFCVYLISVARRMAGLQDDIRRLKEGGK